MRELGVGTWGAKGLYRITVGEGPEEEELIVTGEELDAIRRMIRNLRPAIPSP
jgi:hypothetical protein